MDLSETLTEELTISSEEMSIVEDEIESIAGDEILNDDNQWDLMQFFNMEGVFLECQGNVVQTLTIIADNIGITYESLTNAISSALGYLDERCRRMLSDSDLRDGLPELLSALTLIFLAHTAIPAQWAPVVAICVVLAYKKGVRLYTA